VSEHQWIVTLDLEGVLVPEIWIAVAERTGVEALKRTTRDEPDYDVLMRDRIRLLNEHGLTMSVIREVISGLSPLDGAADFLARLRSTHQVIILSDTFQQFAGPLMAQLAHPTIMCHRLVVEHDRITDYQLRQQDQKRRAVEAFRSIGFSTIAAGDSYNDLSMLRAADHGLLFRAPERVRLDNSDLSALDDYDDLLRAITGLTA
jgi:phosphoserine/homoserine phosphotransferase